MGSHIILVVFLFRLAVIRLCEIQVQILCCVVGVVDSVQSEVACWELVFLSDTSLLFLWIFLMAMDTIGLLRLVALWWFVLQYRRLAY